MEKLVIKQNSIKRIILILFSCLVIFPLITLMFLPNAFPYWTINISVVVGGFLWIIFERNTSIICDQTGCAVQRKRFWENSGKSRRFYWHEVSETVYYADPETTLFYVYADGTKVMLMELGKFSWEDFDNLIETVNTATPHLPYKWEQQENRVGSTYKKIAR